MELAEVKPLIPNVPDKYDEYLTAGLPIIEDFAITYCGVDTLPVGAKMFVAKALEFNVQQSGIASKSMGEVSYTYTTEFPPSIEKLLKPYRKLRFKK